MGESAREVQRAIKISGEKNRGLRKRRPFPAPEACTKPIKIPPLLTQNGVAFPPPPAPMCHPKNHNNYFPLPDHTN